MGFFTRLFGGSSSAARKSEFPEFDSELDQPVFSSTPPPEGEINVYIVRDRLLEKNIDAYFHPLWYWENLHRPEVGKFFDRVTAYQKEKGYGDTARYEVSQREFSSRDDFQKSLPDLYEIAWNYTAV